MRVARKPGSQSANGRSALSGLHGTLTRVSSEHPHRFNNGRCGNGQSHLQTLVIHLPLYFNPDGDGRVKPVEPALLDETLEEIRSYFTGYTSYRTKGWFRDEETGEEFSDETMRIEIDAEFNNSDRVFLRRWKQRLEARFAQRCIYMKILPWVEWI